MESVTKARQAQAVRGRRNSAKAASLVSPPKPTFYIFGGSAPQGALSFLHRTYCEPATVLHVVLHIHALIHFIQRDPLRYYHDPNFISEVVGAQRS